MRRHAGLGSLGLGLPDRNHGGHVLASFVFLVELPLPGRVTLRSHTTTTLRATEQRSCNTTHTPPSFITYLSSGKRFSDVTKGVKVAVTPLDTYLRRTTAQFGPATAKRITL